MQAAAENHQNRAPPGHGRFFHKLPNSPPGRLGVKTMQIATCLGTKVAPTERTQSQTGHAKARSGHAPILPIHNQTLIQNGLLLCFAQRRRRCRGEIVEGRHDSIRAPVQRSDIGELPLEQQPIFVAQT